MDAPLIVFVTAVVLDVLALAVDVWLYATDRCTITRHVWRHPALGVPLVAVQVVAAVALAVHLWSVPHAGL